MIYIYIYIYISALDIHNMYIWDGEISTILAMVMINWSTVKRTTKENQNKTETNLNAEMVFVFADWIQLVATPFFGVGLAIKEKNFDPRHCYDAGDFSTLFPPVGDAVQVSFEDRSGTILVPLPTSLRCGHRIWDHEKYRSGVNLVVGEVPLLHHCRHSPRHRLEEAC